ncbi:MAG: hypothetical protein Q8K11_13895 [Phenylobacterium sp.]|uniref:hypothetical protein n=1 Tax=Phenylobacterium sp. TaxID=1871053 RepID=UPI002731C70F|nr:hypothetical protein [Phenylobacterium sp.]MDP2011260.1 hypothetical protein [Phenylobacterium sp.]
MTPAQADPGSSGPSSAERAAARVVDHIGALIEKSKAEADPRQKIVHLENAKATFAGLCAQDGVTGKLEGRASGEAYLARLEAEYRAAGWYSWPHVQELIAAVTAAHARKYRRLRKPQARIRGHR